MVQFTEEMKALFISGLVGSVLRSFSDPSDGWRRRVVQILVGAACAVFLGELFGQWIMKAAGIEGMAAYSAAGFLMGTAGERGIKWGMDKFLK